MTLQHLALLIYVFSLIAVAVVFYFIGWDHGWGSMWDIVVKQMKRQAKALRSDVNDLKRELKP